MPAHIKDALVRDLARTGGTLNDAACGILADAFDIPFVPSGRRGALPGASPVVLLRAPEALKDAIDDEAKRTSASTNDVILRALADGLGVPFKSNRGKAARSSGATRKESMATTNGSKNGARTKDKVRVAIIGVGNCANSLLQGVEYYKNAEIGRAHV